MEYLPILAIIVSLFSALGTYFGLAIKTEGRIATLETKVDLFWNAIEGRVIGMLKSPTHLEKDVLLDQLLHREIKLDGAQRLRTILTEELKNKKRIDNGKRLAYALALGRLEQVIYDLRGKA